MTDATKLRLAAQFASYAIPPGHEARSDIGPKRAKKGPKMAKKGPKKGPKKGQKGAKKGPFCAVLGMPKKGKKCPFLDPCGAKSRGSGGAPPTHLILLRNQCCR